MAISIRGLSVVSSSQDIETALGKCVERSNDSGSYQCGDHMLSGYRIGDDNEISHVTMHCSFIDGCAYSVPDLASLIGKEINLTEPKTISSEDDRSLMMDGPAGDRLFVSKVAQDLYITISAYNYRKPKLILK